MFVEVHAGRAGKTRACDVSAAATQLRQLFNSSTRVRHSAVLVFSHVREGYAPALWVNRRGIAVVDSVHVPHFSPHGRSPRFVHADVRITFNLLASQSQVRESMTACLLRSA